ncbi:MAG: hypothetical protein ACOC93_04625, partial [Planctomycetota bacterium]
MFYHRTAVSALLALALGLTLAGCGGNGDEEPNEAAQQQPPANPDVQHAQQLWTQIEDYETWPVPQDFEGWQEGTSPHGSTLRYYINDAAQQQLTQD